LRKFDELREREVLDRIDSSSDSLTQECNF